MLFGLEEVLSIKMKGLEYLEKLGEETYDTIPDECQDLSRTSCVFTFTLNLFSLTAPFVCYVSG